MTELKPVEARCVIMKEQPLFVCSEIAGNKFERSVEPVEIAVELVDREVTSEHTPIGAESIDGFQHERPKTINRPIPINRAQSRYFGYDVGSICELSHSLTPSPDSFLIAVDRHPGMVENDQCLRV